MPKWEKCEECGCAYLENTEEYNSIYQTGYCDFCLDEKQEKEKGGRGRR